MDDFSQRQSSEQYGEETYYEIRSNTKNPVTSDGTIKLTWTSQVVVFEDTECTVTTNKALGSICEIDFATRKIIIHDAFKDLDSYSGEIKIVLSRVENPNTNHQLEAFVLETFDDYYMEYPIDKLEYYPVLECNYPCYSCSGVNPDFCTSCWSDYDETYLM